MKLFIQKHWKILCVLAAAAAVLILEIMRVCLSGGKGRPMIPDVSNEIRAIKAEAHAQKLVEQLGAERALTEVELNYRHQLLRLDEEGKAQAEQLRHDPVALSGWLIRAGKGV